MKVDSLFLKQLFYPMCDPSKSSIKEEPRMSYYKKMKN